MLKLRRRRRQAVTTDVALLENPDLRIRSLLDDPRLRRAMGLDEAADDREPALV